MAQPAQFSSERTASVRTAAGTSAALDSTTKRASVRVTSLGTSDIGTPVGMDQCGARSRIGAPAMKASMFSTVSAKKTA